MIFPRFFAIFLSLLFVSSAARAASTPSACFEIVWEANSGDGPSAQQKSGEQMFIVVNGNKQVWFQYDSSLPHSQDSSGKFTNSHSLGCTDSANFNLGSNSIYMNFVLGEEEQVAITTGFLKVTVLLRLPDNKLRQIMYDAYYPDPRIKSWAMQTTYNASLAELSPALAAMIQQKRAEISQAIPAVQAEESVYKGNVENYEAILKGFDGRSFLDLTEEELMSYQEARERYVFNKSKIEEKNKTLADKTQKLKATTAQAKSQIQAAIASEGFDIKAEDLMNFDVTVEIAPFTSIPMSDSAEKYPYDEWANQAVLDLRYRMDSGFRDQFLEKALEWQVLMDHFLPIVQSRATLSKEEFNAFEAAANKVNLYLFGDQTKPGVISRDFWFNDLNLDPSFKSAIDNDLARYNPEQAKRIKAVVNKFDKDIRNIVETLKAISEITQMYKEARSAQEISFVDKLIAGGAAVIEQAPQIATCAIESSITGPYADFYEYYYEKDFCTGEPNDKFDQAIAGVSLVAEAGTLLFSGPVGSWVVDKVEVPAKMIKKFVGVLKNGAVRKIEATRLGGFLGTLSKVDGAVRAGTRAERFSRLKKFFGSSKILHTESLDELERFGKTIEKYGEKIPEWPEGMSFPNDPLHLKNHMTTRIDGLSQKSGLSGCHNLDEFNLAIKENNIVIVGSRSHPTVQGITEYEYKIPKADGSGELKSGSFKKTVYDPKVMSDDEMVSLGQVAAAKNYNSSGLKAYNAEAGGINFTVFPNEKGEIRNLFPSIPNE